MNYKLVGEKPILHRAETQGPRIVKVQYVQTPAGVVAVDFWANFDGGPLIRVGNPRPLAEGEVAA
jgi:hypothetical protein